MRNVISYVRRDILPLPPSSKDVRVKGAPDTYRMTQIALEANQRQQERMLARQSRQAGLSSSAPRQVKTPYPNVPSSLTVFNIPVR